MVRFGLVAAFVTMAGLLVPNYRKNITANASAQTIREVEVKMLSSGPNVKGALADEVSLAIMGASDFDATTVDASSIVFAGAVVSLDAAGNHRVSFEDINHDGFTDLVVRINRRSLRVGSQPIKAEFSARTTSGESLIGTECAQASGVPCGGALINRGNQQQLQATSPGAPNVITFSENFDAAVAPELPSGWAANSQPGPADCTGGTCPLLSLWHTTATNPFSPPNAAFHDDPSCVTDNALDSPVTPISPGASQLSFRNAFNLEGTFDGSVLEISINGGAFTDIITAGGSFVNGGYNGTISVSFLSPIAGRQAWTGLSGGSVSTPAYVNTVVNLPAAAQGQPVKLRWRCATDCSTSATGNSGQWVDDVSINDTQAACTITCPANFSKSNDANQCGAVITYPPPTTGGACGSVSCSPSSGSFFPVGNTVVTCTTAAGPSCPFTVTVNDTQPPTITCPANISQPAPPGSCSAVVTYPDAPANDNCPGLAAPMCTPASGSNFQRGVTIVTCTVADAAGNSGNCTFTITITDTQPPTITCPANITQGTASNLCGAVVTYAAPTVSDNCPGVGTPSCNPPSGSTFPKGVTAVNCSVADASSNTANCGFTVTINDTTPPTITCPPNQSVVSGVATVVNYPPPAAADNCSGVTSSCAPPSGSVFAPGTTTVTCTANDTSANTAACTFTVTVAPCTIKCPNDVIAHIGTNAATCGGNVSYPPPDVAGGCGGATCNPASGSFFNVGTTVVSCNIPGGVNCSFTVIVIDDAAPRITCPNSIVTAPLPGQSSAVVNYPAAVVTDNCPGATAQCSPPTGSRFPLGTTFVTCTAIDTSSNSAACVFSVIVVDSERPVITCPANVAVGAISGQTSAVVNYPPPNVNDNSSVVTTGCLPASGSSFPLGVTTVTCTAADAAGNKSSCSFTVSVGGPVAKVVIPANKAVVEFGSPSPVAPARKPPKAKKNPCGLFSIQNIGFAPLVLTLDSITRTGADVDSKKIADANDTKYFSLSFTASDQLPGTIEIGGVLTIPPGGAQLFCLRFSALIPALAGKATGVAAADALPDTVNSIVNFRQNAGGQVSVSVLSHLATAVIFINATNPRLAPSIGFTRSGNDITVSYALYDPNLDVSRAKYEFLNSSGQVVGSAFEIDLTEQLRALGLVRGQSFSVEQRFTGASDHPEIVGVRVTVFDGETSVTASATAASVAGASKKLVIRTGSDNFYFPVVRLIAPLP